MHYYNSKLISFSLLFLLLSCNSDDVDSCTKIITIPQFYIINNQSYNYNITQEVSCDLPEPTVPRLVEPQTLPNFSYEVLNFLFTPNTGNNTSRLEFEIKLINPNPNLVSGFPLVSLDIDGIQTSVNFADSAQVQCNEIAANSECILTYSQQSSLDLGVINSIELINVQYFLTQE